MSQPLNFRNSANTATYASVIGSSGDTILLNSGIIDFVGKSTTDPCYLKSGRLLPNKITNTADSITFDLKANNNFHVNTSVALSTLNLTNMVEGQSGHIILNNTAANTHSITWQVEGGNSTYIKWQSGSAPTLSSTIDYVDLISYYVYSPGCVLMIASVPYF
tara:strand:+ start:5101 stop:5586 length:486 start_codon:yes stop_codon:yes gene_type:complete